MKNLTVIFILFLLAFVGYLGVQSFRGKGVLTFIHLPRLSGSTSTIGSYVEMPKEGSRVIYPKSGGSYGAPAQVPPQGYVGAQLSPYYKKVYFGAVQRPYVVNDARAFFSLYADSSLGSPVDITGWRVKGNGGYGIELPTAVADFQRTLIAYKPSYRGTDDIVLRPGDYAVFYSAPSPMSGVSFRLNKCIGYLNEMYNFSPALSNECPRAESPRTVMFTGKCQDYLRSIYTCHTPTQDSINASLDTSDSECRAFVNKINYDGCYAEHRSDTDFFSREWRVWLSQFMPFDLLHDRLMLYDRQGLIVNEYTY